MTGVRNISFARGQITGVGLEVVYTVPLDHVLIFKAASFSNFGATAANVELDAAVAGGARVILLALSGLASGGDHQLATWTVLNAGDQVLLSSSSTGLFYWLSGAVLPMA